MIEKKKNNSTHKDPEKAVLVGVYTSGQSIERAQEYLDELAFLATTARIQTIQIFLQKLEKPHQKTYVGKGKLQEIEKFVKDHKIDTVVFDDELSPSQVKNLEATLGCKILDRSLLILNIFALRVQTAQAKIQVELAQYQYLLPRLTRLWTHLSKQKGGVGMRGPGERELETDRRIVNDKIALLKQKLSQIEKQSATRRKARQNMVRVAVVGYTNVGKSTIMNLIAKSEVQAENKLFATVDSTVRKVVVQQVPFLLTDTVGFIRKLPTTLIESFKSTLHEIVEADILLHVVDISHPAYAEQMEIVQQTLKEIGAIDKREIVIFNKIDALSEDQQDPILLNATYQNQSVVCISAKHRKNIDVLLQHVYEAVVEKFSIMYPNNQIFSEQQVPFLEEIG